jgi:hypothetical protein
MPSCTACARSRAAELGHQRQRHVDAGGDTAAGEDVAVAHHAAGVGRHAVEGRQQVAPGPVAGGAPALQQAGRRQRQRAGAHRRHDTRIGAQPLQLRDEDRVFHRRDDAEAARHQQHVGVFDRGQRLRVEAQAAVGVDHAAGGRRQHAAGAGQPPQHLVRAGEVELGDAREQREDDGGHGGRQGRWTGQQHRAGSFWQQ